MKGQQGRSANRCAQSVLWLTDLCSKPSTLGTWMNSGVEESTPAADPKPSEASSSSKSRSRSSSKRSPNSKKERCGRSRTLWHVVRNGSCSAAALLHTRELAYAS